MPNMMSIINNHNKKLLHPHTNDKDLPCNCRNLPDCPLNGKCRTKSIIYKASISAPNSPTQHHFGCCKTEFKTRFIITDNPLITKTKQTPQNFPKQYGNTKIKESNCAELVQLFTNHLHTPAGLNAETRHLASRPAHALEQPIRVCLQMFTPEQI